MTQSVDAGDDRGARGRKLAGELFGGYGNPHLDDVAGLAPDLVRYATEFAFGDIYSRPALPLRDRQLVTVGVLVSIGAAEPQLTSHLHAALNVGITVEELVEAIMHTAVFAGFPRALNGIAALRTVLADADVTPVS
ncbi:MAG: carboxymuconolactone decarboxylase family protein [Actinocatenispora sp.]